MSLINALLIAPFIFTLGCEPTIIITDDDDDDDTNIIVEVEFRPVFERICDNDVDDDHDGYADCSDIDCETNGDCMGLSL
jgi:hypothetical protein